MGADGLLGVGVPATQPVWLLWVKLAIVVFSLIALALGAYGLSISIIGAGGMTIFVAIWSFIVYGGGAALELWAAQYSYRIVSLIGQILAIIFWLSAWAWSASWASVASYAGLGRVVTNPYAGAYGGAAGVGAIVWILTIVHLVFFIRAAIADTNNTAGQAELGQVKVEAQPQYQQPPQQYQQQPVYPVQQQQQPYPAQPQGYPTQ